MRLLSNETIVPCLTLRLPYQCVHTCCRDARGPDWPNSICDPNTSYAIAASYAAYDSAPILISASTATRVCRRVIVDEIEFDKNRDERRERREKERKGGDGRSRTENNNK